METLKQKLLEFIPPDRLAEEVDMAQYTTFRTGGAVRLMAEVASADEVQRAVQLCCELGAPYRVLGNGSNVLVRDGVLEELVLHIGKQMSAVHVFDRCITAQSGATLASVAQTALQQSLCGFEFAAGIPGSVGGAVRMNAGAYGGEMKDVVEAVCCLDEVGKQVVYSGDEMAFAYRHSRLVGTRAIVLSASICLQRGAAEEIRATMQTLAARRREKQPLEYPSAGSTFKRPAGAFAAALIDEAGLRGYRIGGACVSEKHAGFVVNTGGATAQDVLDVMAHVQETVLQRTGIRLEPEVEIW